MACEQEEQKQQQKIEGFEFSNANDEFEMKHLENYIKGKFRQLLENNKNLFRDDNADELFTHSKRC